MLFNELRDGLVDEPIVAGAFADAVAILLRERHTLDGHGAVDLGNDFFNALHNDTTFRIYTYIIRH